MGCCRWGGRGLTFWFSHAAQGPASRFHHLVSEHLCDLDLEELVAASASDTTDCWLRAAPRTPDAQPPRSAVHHGHNTRSSATAASADNTRRQADGSVEAAPPKPRGRIGTVRVSEPRDAVTLFEAGASLYFLSSQAMADEYIGAMNRDLHLGIAGHFPNGDVRGEVEIFASRKGHVTDW